MKRLLLLLRSETYRAADFLAAAGKLGVELVVASDRPNVLAELGKGSTLDVDFSAPEAATEKILAVHEARPLDAVVAAEQEGTLLAAQASRALGLATNPTEAVASAHNKAVFREICAAAGLAAPWFRQFDLSEDPAAVARQVPFPCVLKPLFLSASRGVIRANDPVEFAAAWRRIAKILAEPDLRARGGRDAESLLVESFLPGAEVALEGMIVAGEFRLLAFFDKPEPLNGPFFEETLLVTPSRHPRAWQRAALQAAAQAVAALGLRTGPVHVELRLNEGRATVLELSPRTIGGHCSRSLRFGAGMSLEELVLRQALGLEGASSERERRAAGVMMIPIPGEGRLMAVHGLEEARRIPGIESVEITIPLTQPVVPLPEGNRYLGFIFSKAERPEQAEAALREAHACLQFHLRPENADLSGLAPEGNAVA